MVTPLSVETMKYQQLKQRILAELSASGRRDADTTPWKESPTSTR